MRLLGAHPPDGNQLKMNSSAGVGMASGIFVVPPPLSLIPGF
jgi:hypothetical protein